MTDVETRIAVLEAENRDLKGRLDALAPTKSPAPLPPSPVRITHPVSRVEVPSVKEFERLSEIVLRSLSAACSARGS